MQELITNNNNYCFFTLSAGKFDKICIKGILSVLKTVSGENKNTYLFISREHTQKKVFKIEGIFSFFD